ncbi:MAG: TIM barrel protein [Chthoniobacterales bacterium]
MILPGLCSVTFRQFEPQKIIELGSAAGLRAIEWGGDIHVPHGDEDAAKRVRDLTAAAGLQVSSYGSYYRAAGTDVSFDATLRSAVALGAKTIRVWAGNVPSVEASPELVASIVDDLKTCVALGAENDVSIALEFHDGTLTDGNEAALRLLDAVPGVSIIWQPKTLFDVDYRREGLEKLLPRVSNLHVFQWAKDFSRLPLADGASEWKSYLVLVNTLPGDRFALMEFVAADSPEAFLADAAILLQLLS